jgi:phospholipid/cholesterol/gamma-HCH transport system substrate-binding protein
MQAKFNHFERVAGLFVFAAFVGAITFLGVTTIKKGWLATKVVYSTQVASADGLYEGVPVKISGLRAGEVTDVELISSSEVIVRFAVLEKMAHYIRKDSIVQVVRPFVIGDKAIEISVGSDDQPAADPNIHLVSVASFDMMDLVSGRKLGPFLGSLEGVMVNISTLAKAFADPKRTEALIRMFDKVDPMLTNLNKMSVEVTRLTKDLNGVIPEMREYSPALGKDLASLVKDLNVLTSHLSPTMESIGPELPKASRRALEALDEMVVTLKAIQKSFLLSGNVKEVRSEEKSRTPASDKKD